MLANAGVGSRRQIEGLISQGRIVVDGRRAELGDQLSGGEKVFFDGRRINIPSSFEAAQQSFLAYYKPAGELTSRNDPEGRKQVFESIPPPKRGRWISVGRLDISTSGLLLFTTDGELAHRLMHPRFQVSREYAVRLLGSLGAEQIRQLKSGVELEDGRANFDSIEHSGGAGKNVWYHVTLREGRNREVRRIFEAIGLTVSRLIRVGYGPIVLGKMHRGSSRRLTTAEIEALYRAVQLSDPKA